MEDQARWKMYERRRFPDVVLLFVSLLFARSFECLVWRVLN